MESLVALDLLRECQDVRLGFGLEFFEIDVHLVETGILFVEEDVEFLEILLGLELIILEYFVDLFQLEDDFVVFYNAVGQDVLLGFQVIQFGEHGVVLDLLLIQPDFVLLELLREEQVFHLIEQADLLDQHEQTGQ